MNAANPYRPGADRHRALWHAVAAFACLAAGVLAGGLLHSDTVVWISAATGFFSVVWFLRRALVLWQIDSPLFESSDRIRSLAGQSLFPSGEKLEPDSDRGR